MIPLAQLILLLVLTYIKPKSHTSTVPIPVAHLVHSILTNVQIDVARIIAYELKSVIESGLKSGARVNCPLAFPCLIMSLCLQARVRLPSRGQVRIPPPIDDRYVAKYCKPKNVRSSSAAEVTGASDGPGTFTLGSDPFQQAVCNYNWDWMTATQRAMLDMHDSMQLLQLQMRDPSGEHSMMTREQFLQHVSWPVDRPVFGEGAGAGAAGAGASSGAAEDDDDDDDDATGSEAGSDEGYESLGG